MAGRKNTPVSARISGPDGARVPALGAAGAGAGDDKMVILEFLLAFLIAFLILLLGMTVYSFFDWSKERKKRKEAETKKTVFGIESKPGDNRAGWEKQNK